jgi:hypothetical protein
MWRNGFKTVALAALPLTVALGAVDVSAQWRVVQPRAQQQDMRYAEMDVNGDGVVTRREWTGTRREFNAADWNRDGVLSGEEVRIDADRPVGTSGDAVRRPAARQASEVVFVDAQTRWTPTGIYVNQGDVIAIDARGIVQLSADPGDTAIAAGAYSRRQATNAPLPDALAGALIGRIGPGEAFGIGNQRQITAPASGELFLGVNDDHLQDNRGGFRVQVR